MAYEDKMAFMTDKRCHWRYLEDEPRSKDKCECQEDEF
ncbi:hypothetical protein L917_12809 [Phytophthora nicotianae]|uniref:Uncharacterized protein n=1 Tax=Phytophthora nicotianae TaxID=4792 RepID=W2KSD3_PHYNI|nr:hypothetical protein L917_12809 [Phytophthora nicotianae]